MIRKPKQVETKPTPPKVEPPKAALDTGAMLLLAMQNQSEAIAAAIQSAAAELAKVVAQNKPADGYLFEIKRDHKDRITGMVAKRGRNAQ